MTTSAQRIRDWQGPAILNYGYRPFFLLGPLWAALAMVLWLFMLAGFDPLPMMLDPVAWHAHALIFGYGWAVIAGFLMTAVPNWTGRFPITGWPLAGLVVLWLAGRAAMATDALLTPGAGAAIDLAFPLALGAAITREIVAGRNWRNLKVLAILAVMIGAQAGFHFEAAQGAAAASGPSARLATAALIALIALVGGRIVPSFTRNWLAARRAGHLPAPAGRADAVVMGLTLAALAAWVVVPESAVTGVACLAAAAGNLWRLARWQGMACGAEPLVWVLHLAFLFIPLGFLATGLAALGIGAAPAARHLWLAGAVGLMTLAVMTRASLGHSGRPLQSGPGLTALYLALVLSVVARFAASLWPGVDGLLTLAATGWIAAMAGFAVLYWPVLTQPRLAPKRASRD